MASLDWRQPVSHTLTPADVSVLRRTVRFGCAADYQTLRYYSSPATARRRLAQMRRDGLLERREEALVGAIIYQPTQAGVRAARCGLHYAAPRPGHLAHDVALADLADYLERTEPHARWFTEREIPRLLLEAANGVKVPRPFRNHTPDGILLLDGRRIAVELEHSLKSEGAYTDICRWFAQEVRIDAIRWYVDNPRIVKLVRRVNQQHALDNDIEVKFFDFPPGVVVRRPASR